MASVDTLHAASKAFLDPSSARREQELQAGRLKLKQFKQKRKGKKANPQSNTPAEPRFSQDEETIQQADEQPTICLDSDLHGLGSQNGFRVLKGGTAKADPSILQGRAQGLKQVGQTFHTWDSKVGTGDFENLVSIGSEPESGSVPFSRSDGIQVGAEDLQKFSQHFPNDHMDVEGEMFVDVNSSKMSTPLFSGQHSRLDNGVDDTSWSSNPSLTKLTSGQVLDIPEPDLLPPPSGITPDIKKLTLGDGIASFPLSNWSSLTFSRPFITPPSTVPANGAYSGSRYGNGSVLQMTVSRPESSASPFLPQAEFPSLADPEINGKVSSVSSPVELLHTAPPKSLPLAGMSSSSFSITSPLKPLSFKLLDTDPSQTAATTVPQMESIRSLSPTGLRSKPVPDYSFASVFDSPSFLTSLPSSKPSSEASRPTLFRSKTLPLSKSPLPSFASSNDVSLRPVHLSFLQPVPSEPTIVSTSDFEERLVGIGQGGEGEIMELPHLPLISFLNKGKENYGKTEQEDFLSLEQHIEDLTQEKFSLQRSLDKERAMAESLVLENTVLVEDFNNQGKVVQRLNDNIKSLEGKVRAQEAMVQSMRAERDKAHQESSSAIEQSQTLAGEVIALENRVRTLWSHELRLERDMASLTSDMDLYKRKIASSDRDQAHWKTMVDALQEEKMVMQEHLRKAAFSDDAQTTEICTKSKSNFSQTLAAQQREQVVADASTSTDDLVTGMPSLAGQCSSLPLDSPLLHSQEHDQYLDKRMGQGGEDPNLLSLEPPALLRLHDQPLQSSLTTPPLFKNLSSHLLSLDLGTSSSSDLTVGMRQTVYLPAISSSIPPDLVRIINSISVVITSLGEEKKALLKALKAESTGAAELRALNSDLLQKLEGQTQKLELAVAQRMAHGSRVSMQVAPNMTTSASDFVDEGDEVVDRMLGWIMHLFPGGSSRHNGIKRL